jgi:hypothetical protein
MDCGTSDNGVKSAAHSSSPPLAYMRAGAILSASSSRGTAGGTGATAAAAAARERRRLPPVGGGASSASAARHGWPAGAREASERARAPRQCRRAAAGAHADAACGAGRSSGIGAEETAARRCALFHDGSHEMTWHGR